MSDKEKKEDISSRREMLKTVGALAVGAAVGNVLLAGKARAANEGETGKTSTGAPRWAMVMDLRKCTGCRACTVACKSENGVPLSVWFTVVKDVEYGEYPGTKKYFIQRMCNHCAGNEKDKVPPCVKACPEYPKARVKYTGPNGKEISYRTGATYKRPDGVVLIDNSACTGCGKCIKECPYGSRHFNPMEKSGQDSTKNAISKCTLCRHRIDKGLVPSCVNTCPPRARIFGDLNDPESEVSTLVKEFNLLKDRKKTTMLPDKDTEPYVFYIDPDKVLQHYKIDKKTKEKEFNDMVV
jgi:tetrathionate reductase subunit B